MSATAAQLAELRRMVAEPTETTYSDEILEGLIERYPLIDERGEAPYTWLTSTTPPTQDANEDWIPTYDLHAAAGLIWAEKATALAGNYDFSADGGQFVRHQAYDQYMQLARHHNARRAPRTIQAVGWPQPAASSAVEWVANLAEGD